MTNTENMTKKKIKYKLNEYLFLNNDYNMWKDIVYSFLLFFCNVSQMEEGENDDNESRGFCSFFFLACSVFFLFPCHIPQNKTNLYEIKTERNIQVK